MSDSFQDRVVVVTGAAGRLGRLTTAAFEREGARVGAVVMDAAEARLVPVLPGGRVRCFTCDVTRDSSVRATFDSVGESYGRLDVLVHTVGAWGSRPFLETSAEDWHGLIQVNLTSVMLCFREAARLMSAGSGGRLIAIASAQGADCGVAAQGAYSAAKAGVVRLVESVQDELGPIGISAHAIAPSTLLFDETAPGPGVQASEVVELICLIAGSEGDAYAGKTVRAYGS